MSFTSFIANNAGSFISAASSLGTNALSYSANRKLQNFAQDFSAAEAEKNRQFQLDVSSNQYQRTVADMQAAGINPALAYSNAVDAAPSGSVASSPGSSVSFQDPVSAFWTAKQVKSNIELQSASAEKARQESISVDLENNIVRQTGLQQALADLSKTLSETDVNESRAAELREQKNFLISQIAQVEADTILKQAQKNLTEYQIKVQEVTFNKLSTELQWLSREKAAQISSLLASARLSVADADLAVSNISRIEKTVDNYSFDNAKIMSYGDALSLGISLNASAFGVGAGESKRASISKNSQVLVARNQESGKLEILCEAREAGRSIRPSFKERFKRRFSDTR